MMVVVDLMDVLGDGQGDVLEVEFEGFLWLLARGGGGSGGKVAMEGEQREN